MALNILIAYHSNSQIHLNKIEDFLKSNHHNVNFITEKSPEKLSTRSMFIKKSNALIVIASLHFQKSIECMEILNYSKDLKQTIYGINFNPNYIPYGSLGAILSGTENGLMEISDSQKFSSCMDSICTSINNLRLNKDFKIHDPILDSSRIASPFISLNFTQKECDVLISYHSDSKEISNIIEEELNKKNINFLAEDSSTGTTNLKCSKVILVILSQGYEENYNCRTVIETARQLNKKIIPISKTRAWKPESWLGLITAGKLFYRIFDRQQAYETKYEMDFSPMAYLIEAIMVSLYQKPNEEDREAILIKSLKKQIEECKAKLPEFSTENQNQNIKREKRKPVKVVLKELKADLYLSETNYTVSREFHPPKALFDKYGVPIREKFDCMISYQWDNQKFVREIYMNLYLKYLKIWFDIWGGMEGNTNEAMATAIENSQVILVFLSNKYLKSPNCLLELKYAINCGKPFVFVIVEKLQNLEDWIQKHLDESPKFELKSIDEAMSETINGVSKFYIISQAIRDIGNAQPEYDVSDFSDEIYELKQTLNNALDQISKQTGINRFKTCTRCKKEYEENNNKLGDCKSHRSYYIGGTIIQGRWACCSQIDKNSLGCENNVHIDQERVWDQENRWVPS